MPDDNSILNIYARGMEEWRTKHPEYHEVLDAMKEESDRGMVLVGATLVEWQAGKLLEHFFRSRHDELPDKFEHHLQIAMNPMETKSIMGNAKARYRMCYLLGLISDVIFRSASEFSGFRNAHFAHFLGGAKLTDARLRQPLKNLFKAHFGPHGFEDPVLVEMLQNPRALWLGLTMGLYHNLCPDAVERNIEWRKTQRAKQTLETTQTPPEAEPGGPQE